MPDHAAHQLFITLEPSVIIANAENHLSPLYKVETSCYMGSSAAAPCFAVGLTVDSLLTVRV
jgi:hypothetical protein